MKYLFITLFFISQVANGQSFLKRWHRNYKTKKTENWNTENVEKQKALALSFKNLQQQSFSKNQFSGVGLTAYSQSNISRKTNFHGYETSISGFLVSAANSTSNTISGNSTVGYYYLYKLSEKIALGAQINFLVDFRINGNYDNNTISGETALTFNPKISYQESFRFLKRTLGIEYALSTTAVGFGLWTPTYTSNFTRTGIGFLSPQNFQQFNSRFIVKLPAGKRFPSISPFIGYGWNGYALKVNDSQKAINGIHSIYILANINKLK